MTESRYVDPEWLTNRLRRNGYLSEGKVVTVQVKVRHKHHLALAITYAPAAPVALPGCMILKRYPQEHTSGLREALLYREIAPAMPAPPVPPCYDVFLDDATGETCILLKDLSDTHFTPLPPLDHLTQATFEQIVDAYLIFHAFWWEHDRLRQNDLLQFYGAGSRMRRYRRKPSGRTSAILPGKHCQSGSIDAGIRLRPNGVAFASKLLPPGRTCSFNGRRRETPSP